MKSAKNQLIEEVNRYYTERVSRFGPTPLGVDWNGEESQNLRFEQLARIVNFDGHFSITDFGTGYGAFFDFMESRFKDFSFVGVDISEEMIRHAKDRHPQNKKVCFQVSDKPLQATDYCVASGVFNVKQGASDASWKQYLLSGLELLNSCGGRGFAFNCLTQYSDAEKKRGHLFYADPCELFDFCKKHFSKNVALLHDYGLFEFTLLVRK